MNQPDAPEITSNDVMTMLRSEYDHLVAMGSAIDVLGFERREQLHVLFYPEERPVTLLDLHKDEQ